MDETRDNTQIFLDEVQSLHSSYDQLAARIAKLEEAKRGAGGDVMQDVMIWFAVAYVVSLLMPPLIRMWSGTGIECGG